MRNELIFTIEQVNEFIDSNYSNAKECVGYSNEAKGLKEFILEQSSGLNEFSWFLNPDIEREIDLYKYGILYYKGVRWQIIESDDFSLRIIINRKPNYKIYLENNVWQFEDKDKSSKPFTIARMDELFREFLLMCIPKNKIN